MINDRTSYLVEMGVVMVMVPRLARISGRIRKTRKTSASPGNRGAEMTTTVTMTTVMGRATRVMKAGVVRNRSQDVDVSRDPGVACARRKVKK